MNENFSKRVIINRLKDTNWTSGNKQIDSFIREEKLDTSTNIIFEWISFSQFKYVEDTGNGFSTATWKDGPLYYNFNTDNWERKSIKKVTLKYLYNPQNLFDKLLTKV